MIALLSDDIPQVTDRIEMYEQKYKTCMDTKTRLSIWIKSTKEKGPPSPLKEGYTPPPSSKSRVIIHDYFNFPSLSTSVKRKVTNDPTIVKNSISTLLKKASDSISTTYKPLKKRQNSAKSQTSNTIQTRISSTISTSLNRLSLTKFNTNSQTTFTEYTPPSTKRFSNPTSKISFSLESRNIHTKKPRTQSSILPQSPSSVFLDRLRSRTPEIKQCQTVQSNVYHKKNTHISFDQTISPPSSLLLEEDIHLQKKKKFASLLVTPSLSTIRLISQKPPFLKRQTMLA